MKKPAVFAFALSLVVLGGFARAQQPPGSPVPLGQHRGPRADLQPAQAQGAVTRILLGPGGRPHAVQLDDGTLVMARHAAAGLTMGQRIQVSGFAPQGASPRVIVRPTIRDASGNVIAQAPERGGPGAEGGDRRAQRAQGRARLEALPEVRVDATVQSVVTGPRGGVRLLLLTNNTTLRVPRPLARPLAEHGVRAGDRIRAVGHGNTYPQGTSLVAREITLADNVRLELPAMPAR